ncbi:transport protein [Klebsiella michiganensis]|uniref:Transport protein n=1 Tax=Klebsiella michiganensis TaxID=1134687 RepID=A0A7H4PLP9_9ENTR|nr:transport protein [Klebsiella michiganensis]
MLWVRDANLMLALRFIQALGVCAAAVTWQAMVTDYYPAQRTNRIFAAIYAAGRFIAGAGAAARQAGCWSILNGRAIFAVLFAITLLLMLPALRLKPANKPVASAQQKLTFLTLLRSREYSGNVLIYAACSASFFCLADGVAVYSS